MKTIERLLFLTPYDARELSFDEACIEILTNTSDLASFIRDFKEKTHSVLLERTTIVLEPFCHQTIMDI